MVYKKLIKKIDEIEKKYIPKWLLILLALTLLFRIPNFFEPFSYGDENIYLTLGHGVRQGLTLYRDLHDNKPPLLYLIAAIAGNIFWFKVILAAWNLATIVIFAKLTDTLFPKNKTLQKVASIFFAILTTIPLLEGNIVNAELFMIGPTILGFYLLITQKLNFKNLYIAGLIFSIAALFKIPAAFDIPAILIYWLASNKINKKSLATITKNFLILILGFLTPILLTFIWYFLKGTVKEYFIAAFAQNFGYLSSWRPSNVHLSFIERNRPLIGRFIILVASLVLLLLKRKSLSKNFIFITSWLVLSLFAVTLSERPYPHYLIQSIPAISLLLGLLFAGKTISQVMTIIPLSLAFFVPVYFNFWHYPTLPYYQRFIKLVSGSISKREYLSTFGGNTQNNYDIADLITQLTNKKDRIFVWGDGVAIYAISRRLPPIKYVADYHIRDFYNKESLMEEIRKRPPEIIVILPDSESFPQLREYTQKYYIFLSEMNGTQVFKIISPRARSILAIN